MCSSMPLTRLEWRTAPATAGIDEFASGAAATQVTSSTAATETIGPANWSIRRDPFVRSFLRSR
jgi:hypothetical protein